jgi:hypothetical protein
MIKMKYFIALMDEGTLFQGTTNIKDKSEFFKMYLELTNYYNEIQNYFSDKQHDKIETLLLKYEEGFINEIKFTPHDMRIMYTGLKILDSLVKEPGLLGLVESEFHGFENMEDYWIFDRLEDAKINKEEKYFEIFNNRYNFENFEWI